MTLGCCIRFQDPETLLVWHRCVFVSEITRLETTHQFTVRVELALLPRIKLSHYARINQWYVVLLISSPVYYRFLDLGVMRIGKLSR